MPTTMRHMERDTRFELALSAWKADVLAANTSPALVRAVGLEPTRSHDQRIFFTTLCYHSLNLNWLLIQSELIKVRYVIPPI